MGEKLAFMDAPLLIDESVPGSTIAFISPRRYEDRVVIRRSDRGITGHVERVYEPESEWAKRCAVMTNIGTGMVS